jgi:hypothetical protein
MPVHTILTIIALTSGSGGGLKDAGRRWKAVRRIHGRQLQKKRIICTEHPSSIIGYLT